MNRSRRKMLGHLVKAGISIALPVYIPASALGRDGFVPPSDRITLGFIGCGNQAENDARGFLQDNRVQIIAACDVNRRSKGYWNGKLGGREYIRKMVEDFYSEKTGK